MRFGVALNMPGERDRSDAEVVEEAAARMGGWPSYLWCSREAEEWFGPFAVFCSW